MRPRGVPKLGARAGRRPRRQGGDARGHDGRRARAADRRVRGLRRPRSPPRRCSPPCSTPGARRCSPATASAVAACAAVCCVRWPSPDSRSSWLRRRRRGRRRRARPSGRGDRHGADRGRGRRSAARSPGRCARPRTCARGSRQARHRCSASSRPAAVRRPRAAGRGRCSSPSPWPWSSRSSRCSVPRGARSRRVPGPAARTALATCRAARRHGAGRPRLLPVGDDRPVDSLHFGQTARFATASTMAWGMLARRQRGDDRPAAPARRQRLSGGSRGDHPARARLAHSLFHPVRRRRGGRSPCRCSRRVRRALRARGEHAAPARARHRRDRSRRSARHGADRRAAGCGRSGSRSRRP